MNVANLLLARGAARLPELATRAALGAGRWRLVRQLATEGLMLAAIGGILGFGLAWLVIPALASQISLVHDATHRRAPDGRVLGIAIAVTAIAALVAGVLPAIRLSGATLRSGMAADGRTTIASGQRLRRALVIVQLALSLLLVSATSLLLRTMVHLANIDPGFVRDRVVMLNVRDEASPPLFGTSTRRGEGGAPRVTGRSSSGSTRFRACAPRASPGWASSAPAICGWG